MPTPSTALDNGTLVRDPIGERSLFYRVADGRLLSSRRIHDLIVPGDRLNLAALAAYLSYAYLPHRETLVEGIYKVLPGERVTVRARSFDWQLPPENAIEYDEDALRTELRACLERAVTRRLPAGDPVGVTLSGGIDSSLVTALACRLHDCPVRSYAVSFGSGYRNELEFSSMVATQCGTEHSVVEITPDAVLRHLDDSIALLSDPIGDPLTVPNYILFQEAAQRVKVVLNGEGGDPCFGGPKNLPMLLSELYEGGSRERSYLQAHQKCYDDLPAMLLPAALERQSLEADLLSAFADPRWPSFVTRLMAMNVMFKGAHHILHKVEALSAPFGVTAASPLFDREVVEMAFRIPPQLKLRGSSEKYLLKEAVRDLLPAAIIERPKSGMMVPVEGWFRGPLVEHARERLLDGLAAYGLFRPDYLERLLAGRLGGLRPRHGVKIWLLVTLEAWLRNVFAASRAMPACSTAPGLRPLTPECTRPIEAGSGRTPEGAAASRPAR